MLNSYMKSALFVPCEEKKLNKISELNADIIIFDLEDSVKDSDKEGALKRLLELLKNYRKKSDFVVRVNKSNDFYEMDKLYEAGIRKFMLPKSEDFNYVEEIGLRYDDIKLCLLIETPKGIVYLKEMCLISCVESVAFGAEDFCSQTRMINNDEILLPIKEQIIITAKSFGKMVFDTITLEIYDEDIIKQKIVNSKKLGFDGKLFIHPKQISVMESIEIDRNVDEYRKIIKLFDESMEGILVYTEKIYEKPHIDAMRRVLDETK